MPSKAILQEAQNLRDVCTRLELVADRHVNVSNQLFAICTTIQNTAILLEVLVAAKLDGHRPI